MGTRTSFGPAATRPAEPSLVTTGLGGAAPSTIVRPAAQLSDARSSGERWPAIDVRDFTASGVINEDYLVELIELARVAAYDDLEHVKNIYVPAGWYRTSGPLVHFPSTGIYVQTPGLVGDGSLRTVFEVHGLSATQFAITCGDEGETEDDYVREQRLHGFSIQSSPGGEAGIGCGIDVRLSYAQWLRDVMVTGYNATQPVDGGIGFRMMRPAANTANHQHLLMERCLFNKNQLGQRLLHVGQAELVHCGVMQNTWFGVVWEALGALSWNGGNLQSGTTSDTSRWMAQASDRGHVVVTGWSVTAGLPGGANATLGTPTNGLCTVTGMSGFEAGAARDREGQWLELTAASPGSPDRVTGIYRIVRRLSETSCQIAKNSAHSAATVSWQVRTQYSGVTGVSMIGCYDEGYKRSTYFFGQDTTSSKVDIHGGIYLANCVEAVNTGSVALRSAYVAPGFLAVQAKRTREILTEHPESLLRLDSYTRMRSSFKANDNIRFVDGGGARAASLRGAVKELGAIEAWDAGLASLLTLSGDSINAWTGFINGTSLPPEFAGGARRPLYDSSSSAFGGKPAITTIAGAAGVHGGFVGTIAGSLTNGYERYTPSIFVVFRRANATNSAHEIRVGVQSAGGSALLYPNNIAGGYGYPDRFTAFWHDGGAASLTVASAFAADTAPHAIVVNAAGAIGAGFTPCAISDFEALIYGHVPQGYYGDGNPGGTALSVVIAPNMGGPVMEAIELAFLAVFPRGLSVLEAEQLVDLSRRDWPLGIAG